MLSERHRRALAEIEDRIVAEDPEFARWFGGSQLPSERRRRWPYTLAVVVSALMLICSLILALPWHILLWACLTGLAVAVRHLHTGSRSADRSP